MTIEDPAEKGFITDSEEAPTTGEGMPDAAPGAVVADLTALDNRPGPGKPREYHFPRFERFKLANGLTVVHADVPGRALIAAHLLIPGGGWTEPVEQGGVTVLTSRAMPERTLRRDANDFIEQSERLGAEIHAEATWEALTAGMEVPRSHFGAALALLAEMVFEPAFPEDEVQRLRDERMNDLLQAWSDPRRRAERVFPESIFGPTSPYRRPLAGVQKTVRGLDRAAVQARHAALVNPANATLVVAGDLGGQSLENMAEEHLGQRSGSASAPSAAGSDEPGVGGSRIVIVDKPGAPQSEIRVGHVGVARKNPDFHSISVMNAILGGTFNSRLNIVLREEKGYTYGIGSSFDMRRQAGPFAVRTAVETRYTLPSIQEILRIVREFSQSEVAPDELDIARDYLVGVFPLRFETAAQVASALGGLVALDLPDDELDRYRPAVAAVTAADVRAAADKHIRPDDLVVVVVGDASSVEPELRGAGFGELTVVPADASPE
ncbi:MAG TPA: pitrilysin family protein [Candidatus Limnocylindria bacterium]|nr:pitrilysin family protein [Candidatus Limnocylindria bacterium]